MARDGAGTYTFPVNSFNPAVAATDISPADWNSVTADLATALTASIAKDGQTTIAADIPFNSKKITGLGLATTSGDALAYGLAATVAALGCAAISASGSISTTNISGFVNTNGGVTISTTVGGLFSTNTSGVTVQCVSAGVILTNGATAWASASDEKLKTQLTPFGSPLDKIASLRSGTGRYLTDDEGMSRSFLIAQDVQKVLPEAVDVGEDGILSLRYTEVIPLLVAALAETLARLAALEAR